LSQQLGALQTHTTDTFLFISHTTNVLLFKFRCNSFIGVRIIKEMPGSVASGTPCISWGTHELYRILWNPIVHYNLHNSLSVYPTPRQTNPVHALPVYVFKLYYYDTIIILPCTVSL